MKALLAALRRWWDAYWTPFDVVRWDSLGESHAWTYTIEPTTAPKRRGRPKGWFAALSPEEQEHTRARLRAAAQKRPRPRRKRLDSAPDAL